MEDSAVDVVGRLLALGANQDDVIELFHYVQPDVAFREGAGSVCQFVVDMEVALVVLDSTGEAFTLDNVQPNADEEVARWFRDMPKRLANLGPAVLILDHLPKAGSNDLFPVGSHRKRSGITGAQYLQERITPFSKEKAGASKLVCAKDRHGHFAHGEKVAILHVTPESGAVRIAFTAPDSTERAESGDFRPTEYMERISRALATADGAQSTRGIQELVGGNKGHVQIALTRLLDEGHVAVGAGPRNAKLHTLLRPFHATNSDRPPTVPMRPHGDGEATVPTVPLLKGTGDGHGRFGVD